MSRTRRFFASLVIMVPVIALATFACGGDSDDPETATAGETVTSSVSTTTTETATGEATTGTASTTPAEPSETATTAPAEATASPTAEAATVVPTPDAAAEKAFSNGLVGSAQEALFFMRFLTGEIDCGGSPCGESYAERVEQTNRACANGRWDARRSERGYSAEVHGPLLDLMTEACAMIEQKTAEGTPAETEDWINLANAAYNLVTPEFEALFASLDQ